MPIKTHNGLVRSPSVEKRGRANTVGAADAGVFRKILDTNRNSRQARRLRELISRLARNFWR
jgi:hypothetical protein